MTASNPRFLLASARYRLADDHIVSIAVRRRLQVGGINFWNSNCDCHRGNRSLLSVNEGDSHENQLHKSIRDNARGRGRVLVGCRWQRGCAGKVGPKEKRQQPAGSVAAGPTIATSSASDRQSTATKTGSRPA